MNERKIMLVTVAGGILLVACISGLIYMKSEEIEKSQQDNENLRSEIKSARVIIGGTADLEREVIVLREMSEVIEAILPNAEDVNNLIRTFHDYMGESGVRATSYKPKSTTRRGSTTAFDKVSYQFSLEGDSFQFLDMLDRIETHSRFIAVPSFKITSASRTQIEADGVAMHKVQLDIETYKYDPKNTVKSVRIEGYDRKRDLLAGEINRRRQALTLSSYNYRGPRGRRDPMVDPRVPANARDASAYTVPEQMEIVTDLAERMEAAELQFEAVETAKNVLAAMVARRDLEEMLAGIEDDLRRLSAEGAITYVPAQKRLTNSVYDPLDELRANLTLSQGLIGPSKEMLTEVHDAMSRYVDHGEYALALETFGTVENSLDLLKGDPVRMGLADQIRELAWESRTLRDFSKIEMTVSGVAIMEGAQPAVVINGRTMTIGDMVNEELEITDIFPDEIEFYFRGLILGRGI
ncbi:MAG: hypothetical protein E2O39_03305 [Planctomycetota bacterium]|nr:MAG: hypothetical protein E2O39_03305 [Planctomycetota bacterium]